jgi:hypothetical protein
MLMFPDQQSAQTVHQYLEQANQICHIGGRF